MSHASVGKSLAVKEVAAMLGVSYKTIWRMVRSDILHADRVGRHYRIPLRELQRQFPRHYSNPY